MRPAAGRNPGPQGADQTLEAAGEARNRQAVEEALEAARSPVEPEAVRIQPLAADQTQGQPEAVRSPVEPEVVRIQALAVDQTHRLAARVEARKPAVAGAGQTLEDPLEADQTPQAAGQIHHHPAVGHIPAQAAGQTPEVPVAGQTPEAPGAACRRLVAEAEAQIQGAPQALQEERHKSHRTCRRASLVRRNEGSSWSPSRDGGPTPHRRQHTVVCTPRIKNEVASMHRHIKS